MHPGDVRRGHPGHRRHGAEPVQPRRDRAVGRGGPEPRNVRQRGNARDVRQDRARAADRRAAVRLPAADIHLRRSDADRDRQQGEAARPPALRRGQGDPRRAARERGEELPRAGGLHVLRHGQFQPDDARPDGPRAARLGVHRPGHAAAPGAYSRGDAPAGRDHPRRQRLSPAGAVHRREGDRQRHRRAARHRRLDQPRAAHPGVRARGRGADRLERHGRAQRRGAAARAGLSQRRGRREPVPGRGRPRRGGARVARRGAGAPRHHDRVRRRPRRLHAGAVARRRHARLARSRPLGRRDDPAPGGEPVHGRRGHAAGRGQSRPRDVQDQRGRSRALDDRGAGAGVRAAGGRGEGVRRGRARPRRGGGGPLPGARGPTACPSCTS